MTDADSQIQSMDLDTSNTMQKIYRDKVQPPNENKFVVKCIANSNFTI